jgi:plastocyanin
MKKSKRMNRQTIATVAIFVLLFGVVSSSLMNDAFAAYSTSKPKDAKKPAEKPAPKPVATPSTKSTEVKITIAKGSSSPGCEKKKECFKPFETKVKTGTKVTWTNGDTAAHTATSGTPTKGPDGTFDSSLISAGKTFSYTFTKAGKYDYFCMVHPWMTGKVTVA